MKLKLRELQDGHQTVRVDQPAKPLELAGCGPVTGELNLDKNGDNVLVTGQLSFTAGQECSRCLRSFSRSYHPELDLCYRPAAVPRQDQGQGTELSADDLITIGYHRGEIDLWPEIREAVLLALPLKPLCREGCKGICPSCGADRNARECGCRDERTDHRWDKLKKLTGK
jgi:uncharacterized protein